MTEELEVRYMVESVDGIYCVSGYVVNNDNIHFTEGDGVTHSVPIKDIVSIMKESVKREDVTSSIKEATLV